MLTEERKVTQKVLFVKPNFLMFTYHQGKAENICRAQLILPQLPTYLVKDNYTYLLAYFKMLMKIKIRQIHAC